MLKVFRQIFLESSASKDAVRQNYAQNKDNTTGWKLLESL